MSRMTLEVSFLAGTDIKAAITEAIDKCIMLDLAYVGFKFNTVRMSIRQTSKVNECIKLYEEALAVEDEKKRRVIG